MQPKRENRRAPGSTSGNVDRPEWPGASGLPKGCLCALRWSLAVRQGRFAGCLDCYCLLRCAGQCHDWETWYERGRCTGCGEKLYDLMYRPLPPGRAVSTTTRSVATSTR